MPSHAIDDFVNEPVRPFAQRLGEAARGGGFAMEGYWVWCGSVARGEDGRYHMFASRWPKAYPFFQGYTAASEIVRASADHPAGPFEFEELVLGPRDPAFWDGRMTHNPFIFGTEAGWFLFYCGATYPGEATPEAMWELNRETDCGWNGRMPPWMNAMYTGVARAETITGPWERPAAPLALAFSAEHERVVNGVAVQTFEGACRLYYRNTGHGLATACADHPAGPYPRESMHLYADHQREPYTEDPVVFRAGRHYEMLSKDGTGRLTGEPFALLHSVSRDGIHWRPAAAPKGASRRVRWDDGRVREQGNLERPFVLMEAGEPAYLYAATSDGVHRETEPAHKNAEHTWNMVIPLTR